MLFFLLIIDLYKLEKRRQENSKKLTDSENTKMSEEFIQQCCDKATACISNGDYEKAKKFLKKAADRDPGNSNVIALLQIVASHEQRNASKNCVAFRL